jgi:hypothetical protein
MSNRVKYNGVIPEVVKWTEVIPGVELRIFTAENVQIARQARG